MIKNLESMLPFLESEDLLELAKSIINDEIDMNLISIVPFMDEDDVDKICVELADNPDAAKKFNLLELYPFASDEFVDKLFLSQMKQGNLDMEAVPFVSDECLHKVVLEYAENPDLDLNIDELYPFLDSEDVSLLFRAYLKNCKKKKTDNN